MPHQNAGHIFPGYEGRFYRRDEWEGLLVHRVWIYAKNGSNLKRMLNYVSFSLTCLFGLARAKKPDCIFVDSPPLVVGVPGWIAAKCWRVPLVFNVADLWPDSVRDLGVMRDGLFLKIAYGLERWIYRHSTAVTAVTEGIGKSLLGTKQLSPEKVLFLPNGVDTTLFSPRPCEPNEALKQSLGLDGKRIVLYAGNHGYAGAVEYVLYAANILREETAIHFLLVGEGPEKHKLMDLASSLNLKNVTFHRQVPLESLPPFASIADLAVITLRKSQVMEGARPAKSFVMMAAGKPIVLAAEGDAARLVESAGSGVTVPFEDHESLANEIRSLLVDPERAAQLGMNGRRFVVTNFQWSSLVSNWLAQLSKVSVSSAHPKGELTNAERDTGTSLSND